MSGGRSDSAPAASASRTPRWRRAAAAALLLLVAAGACVFWLERRLHEPYAGWAGEFVDVLIQPGDTAGRAAERLERAGVLRDRLWLLLWLRLDGGVHDIRAGEYRFSRPVSPAQVGRVLLEGRVLLHAVTVPEGATRWQVAEALARAGFGDAEEALAATAMAQLVADLDPEAATLEGYLYPDTYLAPAGTPAERIVRRMVERFRREWSPARAARAARLGMSVREVVTLASIIEAETPVAAERPLVSAVLHNRLRRGMRLQTDPTVLYAMRLAGIRERRIRRSDLRRDSPYNTYVVAGLPPGPIGNPRAAAIDAALYPADVDYLYFVARNDGTHQFSRTLAEHNRMVEKYQR